MLNQVAAFSFDVRRAMAKEDGPEPLFIAATSIGGHASLPVSLFSIPVYGAEKIPFNPRREKKEEKEAHPSVEKLTRKRGRV